MGINVQIIIACDLGPNGTIYANLLNHAIPFSILYSCSCFFACAFVMADTNLTESIERTPDNIDVAKNREKTVELLREATHLITSSPSSLQVHVCLIVVSPLQLRIRQISSTTECTREPSKPIWTTFHQLFEHPSEKASKILSPEVICSS